MKTLSHGQLARVNDCKMTIGTSSGFDRELKRSGDTPCSDDEQSVWTVKNAACLCSYPGYYEREAKRWAGAIELVEGELVQFDDTPGIFKVKIMGLQYSDPIHFIKQEGK